MFYWCEEFISVVASKVSTNNIVKLSHDTPCIVINNEKIKKHIACLPGFTSSLNINTFEESLQTFKNTNYTTAFLQCRLKTNINYIENTLNNIFNDTNHYSVIARTLYVVDINNDLDVIINKCSGSERRRKVRKSFKKVQVCHHYNDDFNEFYFNTAVKNNFPATYRYNKQDLRIMNTCNNNLLPFSLYDLTGKYCGGALFGRTSFDSCDYILGSFETDKNIDGRVGLIQCFAELKKLGITTVNLGGGIQENDKLAEFKKSLGSYEALFYNLKIINNFSEYKKTYLKDYIPSKQFPS
jgi:hypothetical protein